MYVVVIQGSCCAVAPPQCSMKDPLPALLITLVYDGMDATCTASTESTSLLHLHAWHTLRGAEKLRRTNEGSSSSRLELHLDPAFGFGAAHVNNLCPNRSGRRRRRRVRSWAEPSRTSIFSSVPRSPLHRDRPCSSWPLQLTPEATAITWPVQHVTDWCQRRASHASLLPNSPAPHRPAARSERASAASQPEAADLLSEAGVRPELPSGPQAWTHAGIFMEVRLDATSAGVCRRVMLSAIAVLRGLAGRTSTSSRSG